MAVNAPEVFCIISWLDWCSFKPAWCFWIVCVCCAFLCIKRHLYSVLLCSDVASMVLYGILIITWKCFYCFNILCVASLSLFRLKSCCIFFFFKENPLDNFSALRLIILSICSAIDAVFHTHYCHVRQLRPHLPQCDSCLVIICRHYMMDLTVKDIVRRASFLFYFMFSELLFVLFPISLFELSFSVCWLFAVFSLFVTINMCRMEIKVCHNILPLCPICGNT